MMSDMVPKKVRVKTFKMWFRRHLPSVEFEVRGRSLKAVKRRVEKEIKAGKGPIFDKIKHLLFNEVLVATRGKPSVCLCPDPGERYVLVKD